MNNILYTVLDAVHLSRIIGTFRGVITGIIDLLDAILKGNVYAATFLHWGVIGFPIIRFVLATWHLIANIKQAYQEDKKNNLPGKGWEKYPQTLSTLKFLSPFFALLIAITVFSFLGFTSLSIIFLITLSLYDTSLEFLGFWNKEKQIKNSKRKRPLGIQYY